MGKFRVVVTDQVFPDVDVERSMLSEIDADLEVASGELDAVLKVAEDADALLNAYLPMPRLAIERLRRCRVVARYGIGVDNVDLDAAREAGIIVTNVPDYCIEEVAAHTLALTLALLRRLRDADLTVRSGGWGLDRLRPIERLSQLTVGLIGYGKIPHLLARWLRAMGMSVQAHDPYTRPEESGPRLVEFEELLRTSDIVSIHAPLTPETRGLIGAEELRLMRPNAVLVNTSRGPLVQLADVLQALRSRDIAGAALDVFEEEPPDVALFQDVPNLLVTPHMAYYSEAAIRESQRKAATQVVKVLSGAQPDYPVT